MAARGAAKLCLTLFLMHSIIFCADAKKPEHGKGGATGAQGATGTPGAAGAAGAAGATGAQGATGAPGLAGATGAQGATGNAGPPGMAGATGTQGTTGSAGARGATGSQGSTGQTGQNGATGAQGTTGTPGQNGAAGVCASGQSVVQTSTGTTTTSICRAVNPLDSTGERCAVAFCPSGFTLINGGCDVNGGDGRTSRAVCTDSQGAYVPCASLPQANPLAWACSSVGSTEGVLNTDLVAASAECCGAAPGPGQTCATANIAAQTGDTPFDTSSAIDTDSVCGSALTPLAKVVWFRWAVPSSDAFRFDVTLNAASANKNVLFSVYSACGGPSVLCQNSCVGSCQIGSCFSQGQQWLIAVGSNAPGGIAGTLSITQQVCS